VTLTTACCVLLWLVIEKCGWRHVWLAAAAFVLLFHTHLLGFLTAAAMAALSTPVIIHRHRDWFRKMAVFAAVVAAGTLPWIIATGFHAHHSRIPRAWPFLQIPADLLHYPPLKWSTAAVGLLILMVVWVYMSRSRVSRDVSAAALRLGPVLVFLGGWTLVGYTTFLLCIPAVSFAHGRLSLSYWGPLFLLGTVMGTTLARVLAARFSWRVPPVLASLLTLLLWFFATGHSLEFGQRSEENKWAVYEDVFRQLDSMHLDAATKLYASPNSHLVLSVYSGLPIQDITPVKKSYLDSYRGDLVYINLDVAMVTGILDAERVRAAALRSGYVLSSDAAEEALMRLRTRPYRESIMEALAPGEPSTLEPLPAYAQELLAAHRAAVASAFTKFDYDLVTRGFQIRDWSDWVSVLKYRFVDPQARRGRHANYVDRLRGADAIVLWRSYPIVIYHSRWHSPDSTESLVFRFVR
jgi:hypothetical protein